MSECCKSKHTNGMCIYQIECVSPAGMEYRDHYHAAGHTISDGVFTLHTPNPRSSVVYAPGVWRKVTFVPIRDREVE